MDQLETKPDSEPPDRDEGKDWRDWERPFLAVDAAVLTVLDDDLHVLVYRRPPPRPGDDETVVRSNAGKLALPGVFSEPKETFEDAVRLRALKEKTGLGYPGRLHPVVTWNRHDRDPRGWVVTVLHIGAMRHSDLQAAIDPRDDVRLLRVVVPWADAIGDAVKVEAAGGSPVKLAFDHDELLGKAVAHLRRTIWSDGLLFDMAPESFTLRVLQNFYDTIVGTSGAMSRTSFRRRVLDVHELVEPTGEYDESLPQRPELFRSRSG